MRRFSFSEYCLCLCLLGSISVGTSERGKACEWASDRLEINHEAITRFSDYSNSIVCDASSDKKCLFARKNIRVGYDFVQPSIATFVSLSDTTLPFDRINHGAANIVCGDANTSVVGYVDVITVPTFRSFICSVVYDPVTIRSGTASEILNVNLIANGFVFFNWESNFNSEGGYPSSIGGDGGSSAFAEAKINEYQGDNSGNRARSRNAVKPFGYPDLPVPEAPLGGALFFVGGAWLTSWGFRRKVLGLAHIAGWLAMVSGGVVLLLWAIPFLAEMVPRP
jgi:hypothetical protein